jgi:AcrR family transcriptional regulator
VRRRKPAAVDRDELLEAGAALALKQGLHAVAAPAAGAGVAPPAVQHLEPVSDAFVAEVFSRIVSSELAEVKRVVLAHPSPRRQLQALVETLAEPARSDVGSVWLESWSLGRRNAPLAAAIRREQAAWHGFVAAVIRRGVRSGDFLEADPDSVAAQVLAVLDGLNGYSLVDYSTPADRMRLLAEVVRAGLGVGLSGEKAAPAAQ